MKDQLAFEIKSRDGFNNLQSGISKSQRHYIDFLVSGKSLGEILGAEKLDLIGNFGWTESYEYENEQVSEFLKEKKPTLETDRNMFYVCPECGGISCGALTGKISETENEIIWSDFAYENNYEDYDLTEYKNIGPFIFDKKQYHKKMNELIK
ncbi:hypothetical protein AB9K26_01070 [Psychroserpens sp. XS_ASV72]|uniref:hypothetical protein n=1 Tax=Psychroserpens sp. XS_ASV72 TaxID=3241293 RepID=UPI003510F63A